MTRPILNFSQVHPTIQTKIALLHADVIEQVQSAALAHPVLVVGMSGNPVVTKARKLLEAQHLAHGYLEFGSYFSQWRRRNALKMWTGWPTFPMVFVRGTLIGGFEDLAKLNASGELAQLLAS